jgi:hypothetical protein
MLATIVEAAQNFCVHQIRSNFQLQNGASKKRTLIAYIDVNAREGKKYRTYVACDENFTQRVSTLFLEEDESDEGTLIDMTLETANLIVGSAKVIAEGSTNAFTINTPHFEKIGLFDFEYDQAKTLIVGSDELTIAIKELNG